jgi:hypothetical protein
VEFRYSDLTQDGLLALPPLTHAMGKLVWQRLLAGSPLVPMGFEQGMTPVLTRLVLEGGTDRLALAGPFLGTATTTLAHTRDERGEINRLLLNCWCTVDGSHAESHRTRRPPAGAPRVLAGRAFGEHVWTRPWGAPAERKVLRFDFPGVPPVPDAPYDWRPPGELLELPGGARAVESALTPDATAQAWGLMHTDSNQHVNSLVYPRVFEEAVLRRLARVGRSTRVLCSAIELAFRKPCFAGDKAMVWLRLFETAEGPGAVGGFFPANEGTGAQPFCTVRAAFRPEPAPAED